MIFTRDHHTGRIWSEERLFPGVIWRLDATYESIKISTTTPTTDDALTPQQPQLPALMHATTLSSWQRRTASLMDRGEDTTTATASLKPPEGCNYSSISTSSGRVGHRVMAALARYYRQRRLTLMRPVGRLCGYAAVAAAGPVDAPSSRPWISITHLLRLRRRRRHRRRRAVECFMAGNFVAEIRCLTHLAASEWSDGHKAPSLRPFLSSNNRVITFPHLLSKS